LISWLGDEEFTTAQNCSDCMLGVMQTNLNSPFAYSPDMAADFDALTSSCGNNNFPYTSPIEYALSATSPYEATAAPAPTCANAYVVQDGDTCKSIALAQSVSTYSISNLNNLMLDCTGFQVGATLCLSEVCSTYSVEDWESCEDVVNLQNGTISEAQLLAWNPNLNGLCGNLHNYRDSVICVG
jgi:hypothetical protein